MVGLWLVFKSLALIGLTVWWIKNSTNIMEIWCGKSKNISCPLKDLMGSSCPGYHTLNVMITLFMYFYVALLTYNLNMLTSSVVFSLNGQSDLGVE